MLTLQYTVKFRFMYEGWYIIIFQLQGEDLTVENVQDDVEIDTGGSSDAFAVRYRHCKKNYCKLTDLKISLCCVY